MSSNSTTHKPLFEQDIGRFRFLCRRNMDVDISTLFCALLRGNIGFLIKKNCCIYTDFRKRACEECVMGASCSYPSLFSPLLPPPTIDSKGRLRIGQPPPRPFVIQATSHQNDTSLVEIEFCLFGPALAQTTFFCEIVADSLLTIHQNNHHFLTDIVQFQPLLPKKSSNRVEKGELISSLADWIDNTEDTTACQHLSIRFNSPFCPGERIRNMEHDLAETLLKTVIRRLRDLKRAYGKDNNMGKIDKKIFKRVKEVRCAQNQLCTKSGTRYSHSQNREITLTGIAGETIFTNVHTTLLPFFKSGELIQLGKGTSWGLGSFKLKTYSDDMFA